MDFKLHPNLVSKIFIIDLKLCRVLMEDERNYPWIFLVPRRDGIKRIMDMNGDDQQQLMVELDLAQNLLWKLFQPDQLNVAAIGNKTPQLHVHVIARFTDDPAWPGTVWDHPERAKYAVEDKDKLVKRLVKGFSEG